MSATRLIWVKSKLRGALGKGITASEAVRNAEAAVAETYEANLVRLDDAIASLEQIVASVGKGAEPDHQAVYSLATGIIDVSICVRDSYVDHAARALCDLMDQSAHQGVWDQEAVSVHVNALRLLRSAGPAMGPDHRAQVVQGLREVTRKLGRNLEAAG